MTLANSFASPLSSPANATVVGSASATATSTSPRGFGDLDERVVTAPTGVLIVHAPTREAARAAGAHVARRVGAFGANALEARARDGAPLWREVATLLGLGSISCDPFKCAEEIAQASLARRAVIVAPLPIASSWDRAVAAELSTLAAAPLLVFVCSGADVGSDLRAEAFEIGATLDSPDMRRWWSALADHAHGDVVTDDLAKLDAWWSAVRRAPVPQSSSAKEIPPSAQKLFAALSLLGRAWPTDDLAVLGSDGERLRTLERAGAVCCARGLAAIDAAWETRALEASRDADGATLANVAAALVARQHADPWAHARAAELLLRAGAPDSADAAHATAVAQVDDPHARRELVMRWAHTVDTLPPSDQLRLRVRAAERALTIGEAEEAYRWAQSAGALAPDDAQVTLLFGRAAVALGDLVAAKVALQRGRAFAQDAEAKALIAVELSEVAYLGGDMALATLEANAALASTSDQDTLLKARNTLGKILLADAKWDEANEHFAADAWAASSHGLLTAELRARLNRGIALLSKGLVDEARAIFDAVYAEGERIGDGRACAFALDNLAVVATNKHDYASALVLSERTLKLRQRLGDRLTTARILANLAELRRKLGLLDHAEHAVAFGRRTLGPGMPPARSARFCIVAGRIALARGNTAEARREIARAIVDFEAAGLREYVGEAHRVGARIALEDGDLGRLNETLSAARELATTEEARAEVALLTALHARASGDNDERLATFALALARATGEEELLIEAHALVSEIHRANGNVDAARAHVEQAIHLRDQVAESLTQEVRAAFLARTDVSALARLQNAFNEPAPQANDDHAPRAHRTPRASAATSRELVGDDPAIRSLLAAVKKVARANSTVLIRGESGTGKELVAEAVHRASERANGPLVTVNCAALVETLLLSELFGHEKGAFTGAIARRRGRFELAEGGTLFLDEIGDISARTQVALLRVLQERTFERVGGTTPIRANVRIICATHRDLRAMVERGEFREDLYYRLRGITLELPPLRARMGDLPRISENLLARIAAERGEASKTLGADALDLLSRHRWAGNVRELENALRAASLFAESDVITAAHLVENVDDLRLLGVAVSVKRPSFMPPPLSTGPVASESIEDSSIEREDVAESDEDAPLPNGEAGATAVAYAQVRQGSLSLSDMKRQIERDCIARALAETKGNITRAAALLGMKRPRLSQLVKQYGLAAVSSEAS